MSVNKIKIGISSCLLGNRVRYDGGHKYNEPIVTLLGQNFTFIPFCPEVEVGMGIPRDPIQLEWRNGQVRCVDIKHPEKDITELLTECANQQQIWLQDICGYIFKQNSPSCGIKNVKLFKNGIPELIGQGIYAAQLIKNFPTLPVTEEQYMEDPGLRKIFIAQVRAYNSKYNT